MFYREKKIDCYNYREADIIARTDNAERAVKGKRRKRQKESEPKQKNLNDENARRYLVQLGNGNFGSGDIHTSCTYDNKHLPETPEEANRIVNNYLKRIAYRMKKLRLGELKYILVTEYQLSKDGTTITRIHHHIIMNGGLDREEVEAMWTDKRINWNKYENDPAYKKQLYEFGLMGWVNADRLQMNENGIEALCKYVTKNPQGKKRWSSSRNLIRPEQRCPADHKYSRAQVAKLAKMPDAGRAYFEKQFPNYNITSIKPKYYQETGWHIYLKMWRKEPKQKPKPKQEKKRKTNHKAIPKRE